MSDKTTKQTPDGSRGYWFTTEKGQHLFAKEGETPKEACERYYAERETKEEKLEALQRKVEGGEKIPKEIENVHIDITKDNILPPLSYKALRKMGLTENKEVLVKKSSIDRNLIKHSDVKPGQFDFLIGNTLYNPDNITKGKNASGNYFSFTKRLTVSDRGNVLHGVVLLDVTMNNDRFEVVHWHWVKEKGLKSI